MRRFFISPDQISSPKPQLCGTDAHHLRSVLRLKVGDEIIVFDGQGQDYRARISRMAPSKVTVTLLSRLAVQTESPLELVLAQGYLKDKKMDRLVRPLTEIGIARWVPFSASRSVAVPDKMRFKARCTRWQKLSNEAVKQCGRSRPIAIEPEVSIEAVLEHAARYDLKLIFYEKSTSQPLVQHQHLSPSSAIILIGPEGGFDPAEVDQAVAMGFIMVGMGPRMLRAETAALAACTLVQHHYGDLG